jgi:hypothetical protein
MTSPPAPDHQWQWRQPSGPGWATWQANLPGPLGDDRGVIAVGRRAQGPGRCIACGRHARLWHATVLLPTPFPAALDADAGGCSRAHATHAVPTDWKGVAATFATLASTLREADQPMPWLARLAATREAHAERARWLADQPAAARQLAFRLWAEDAALSIADLQTIVAGVLAEPERPRPTTEADTGWSRSAPRRR